MRSVLLAASVASATAYFQPGCFDEYQCIFHRFPVEIGLKSEYSWDLRNLCAPAGGEYTAIRDSRCQVAAGVPCPAACFGNCDANLDLKPTVSFNICGTVSKPIAPVSETPVNAGTNDPQTMPLPHSHGVAIQYVEGSTAIVPPGYGPAGGCADLDTCDQQYNPTCAPNSPNYPTSNAAYGVDPTYKFRADRCVQNGASYCSSQYYWCCSVKPTPCTKEGEVLAYYDGSPPIFNLLSESNPNGVSLSYIGALPFSQDPYPCGSGGATDPSTGLPPTRSLEVQISCDKSVKKGLSQPYFYERSTCQYVISTSSAAACGSKGDPFDKPYTGADAFGFVVLGATLVGFCYIVWAFGESKGWWEPIKSRCPDVSGYLPSFLGGRGGVFSGGGSSSYKFVGASSGAAAPSATPISASAYGST